MFLNDRPLYEAHALVVNMCADSSGQTFLQSHLSLAFEMAFTLTVILQILIDYLIEVEHFNEAAVLLTKCLNDEDFHSKKGISCFADK